MSSSNSYSGYSDEGSGYSENSGRDSKPEDNANEASRITFA